MKPQALNWAELSALPIGTRVRVEIDSGAAHESHRWQVVERFGNSVMLAEQQQSILALELYDDHYQDRTHEYGGWVTQVFRTE